jgi:hypothetical protein
VFFSACAELFGPLNHSSSPGKAGERRAVLNSVAAIVQGTLPEDARRIRSYVRYFVGQQEGLLWSPLTASRGW